MSRRVNPTEWVPQGGLTLEITALRVATGSGHAAVVAGPGAGKTELLAQRACFLLQTSTCSSPRRILAISFKKDAARTLQERVARRAVEMAARFDSYTFDAFAKSILDRFLVCLPPALRPPRDYRIVSWSKRDSADFLRELRPPRALGTTYDLVAFDPDEFMRNDVLGQPLRSLDDPPATVQAWAAQEFWRRGLHLGRLTFPMIGRLAEAVLHFHAVVLAALRQTYTHVLLDEFQDTTHVQYDLVRTAFRESSAVLTAVGDHKQRIMGWAMALRNAFARFEEDFGAQRYTLLMNYRSAPELVRIQEFMVRALDAGGAAPVTPEHLRNAPGTAMILEFPDHNTEALFMADFIQAIMAREQLTPRDICILVKQKPDTYAQPLIHALRERGINARIENELQDLLVEPLADLVLSHLRLATSKRAPDAWAYAVEFACATQGIDTHHPNTRKVEGIVAREISSLRHAMTRYPTSEQELHEIIECAMGTQGRVRLKHHFGQYRHGTYLGETIVRFREALWESVRRETSWVAALENFMGVHAVPVMTIHKSKGLEYHTVIFLGLEDAAFWSFANQPTEDTCAFFVAFSRAKHRVLFTFCDRRPTGPQHQHRAQANLGIQPLYAILEAAGVQSERIAEWPLPIPAAEGEAQEAAAEVPVFDRLLLHLTGP